MIPPTNGRIVLFTPGVSFAGGLNSIVQHDKAQKLPAMICHVWGDRMVNLLVTDSNGQQHPMTSVDLVQSEADLAAVRDRGRYCEWMPFQKGQAAKTEAVEAALAMAVTPVEPPKPGDA